MPRYNEREFLTEFYNAPADERLTVAGRMLERLGHHDAAKAIREHSFVEEFDPPFDDTPYEAARNALSAIEKLIKNGDGNDAKIEAVQKIIDQWNGDDGAAND
jgi:hypothetical protein